MCVCVCARLNDDNDDAYIFYIYIIHTNRMRAIMLWNKYVQHTANKYE